MKLNSVTWRIFFSMQDMQTHLCDYLDICLAPQQEICRLSAQQSASLESKQIKRQHVEHPGSAGEELLLLLSVSQSCIPQG